MDPKTKKLTQKQITFACAYVRLGNATEAYQEAYTRSRKWKKGVASVQACRLLAQQYMQAYIETLRAAAAERAEITVADVLREYAAIGFSELPDFVDLHAGKMTLTDYRALTPAQRKCIKKTKVKTETTMVDGDPVAVDVVDFELHDKLHALDMIGKHLGMFTERVSLDVPGLSIQMNLVGRDKYGDEPA